MTFKNSFDSDKNTTHALSLNLTEADPNMQDTALIEKTLSCLVCPSTGGRLLYDKKEQNLISPIGKLSFPIKNNIPIMLIEEAAPLSDEQVENYLKKLK